MGGAQGPQGVNRKNCCARLKRAQQFLLQSPTNTPWGPMGPHGGAQGGDYTFQREKIQSAKRFEFFRGSYPRP